jgi:hypothetical protein
MISISHRRSALGIFEFLSDDDQANASETPAATALISLSYPEHEVMGIKDEGRGNRRVRFRKL